MHINTVAAEQVLCQLVCSIVIELFAVASFPGLPTVQFLMASSMLKLEAITVSVPFGQSAFSFSLMAQFRC